MKDKKKTYCQCAKCGKKLTPGVRTFRLHISAPYDAWDTLVCEKCHDRFGSYENT